MNKARLLKLAAHLDRVPPEKFDMNFFGEASRAARHRNEVRCATKACALGWATSIPEFAKAGLELRAYPESTGADVYYKGESNFDAAEIFFGLDSIDASRLFSRGSNDPILKAAEIRGFVRDGRLQDETESSDHF